MVTMYNGDGGVRKVDASFREWIEMKMVGFA